ncbi:hypothetical protein COU87_03295 [Candidatus Roizmanbacteria bacterium CG10_big_fil_rev_8_21_14_0_10_39_12]|uniref:AAA+ ATPase domain-containing protein n=1 Tax=Candidatus Roizmanbacteria bacterium CG10_big_fil_rev_8_21_14_0_10_39_12 TaxID=1974852 RepID=A0A2M8KP53_9BACT|nr:MAG: hypothetical protein COY15_03420 [Candidatus Roizmanbacteria bacterium CG_4_10_14_0_2_um_filter_39_12]PJE61679.1 MAG: hypothetical protein COU87_03295 [Candidatus Roizmanbacteria bacterium CG10_big_fil_rev_8_21_14_0_10_39_12]
MIHRFIENQVLQALKPRFVVCLFGARRVGKTYLLEKIKTDLKKKKILVVEGQDLSVQEKLSSQRIEILKNFVGNNDFLFIDEAQSIPNIGVNLKLIADAIPVSVLVTGSSAFDLKNKIGEPLVGRSLFLNLFPISQLELSSKENFLQTSERLEERLIFGGYPDVITADSKISKIAVLENLRDSYLLKDILMLDNLKDSIFVFNLLRQIAFQIGHDISHTELAQNLNSNPRTIQRYLELLEKTFILFSLRGFSRNLRKEYTKTPRYYFWDNGVRNVLISNFNELNVRDDVGQLWENYCVVERIKKNKYKLNSANYFFWRTYDQKEIDLIEERNGKLYGYEMKFGKPNVKKPVEFLETYSGSQFQIINKENYLDFIT